MASGRHPAFGYVDYPPIVPLLSRLETAVLGVTPVGASSAPGTRRWSERHSLRCVRSQARRIVQLQALALLIGVTEPIILGTFLFQTVIFDQVAWMLSLYWFLSLVIDRTPRNWILLGVTLGLGLEIKFLILALIAGMGFAVVLTPSLRSELRTKYPWIAVALMLLIWAPNVVWQIANGLPTLAYILNHQGDIQSGGGVGDFIVLFLVLLFLLTPLWIAAIHLALPQQPLRPIGIACAVPMFVYLFVGKYYYPAPTIPIVMAAGLLAMSRMRAQQAAFRTRGRCRGCKPSRARNADEDHDSHHSRESSACDRPRYGGADFAATVGWVSITNQLTSIYAALSPRRNARRRSSCRPTTGSPARCRSTASRAPSPQAIARSSATGSGSRARCGNRRADGRLRSVGHPWMCYVGEVDRASHRPVPRRQW